MNLETMVEGLTTMGLVHEALPSGSDGAVLLLPDYGRILGVWPHWRAENALWVNPAFLDFLRLGVKDDGWMNPGGDHMWLSPQEEFVPDHGEVPAAIDPGRYVRLPARVGFTMENRGEVRAWKSNLRMRFRLSRHVRVLEEPALASLWGESWLRRAGYEEETTLEVDGERPAHVGLWSFTLVGAGAEFRLPRHGSLAVCIQRRESGRAHLLAKRFGEAGNKSCPEPLVACRAGDPQAAGEISCSTASVPSHGKQKLLWKTSLCAFSGRIDEIEAIAARILA